MANQTIPISQSVPPAGISDVYELLESTHGIFPYISATIVFLLLAVQLLPSRNKAPVMNPRKWYEVSWSRAMKDFTFNSKEMLQKAMDASDNKPFQLYTNQGMLTVLPPRYINEIKNDDRLNLSYHVHHAFFGSYPGFEASNANPLKLLIQVTHKHITPNLPRFTEALAEECSVTLKEQLTDSPDWHTIAPQEKVATLVGKMATRVFLGKDFCEDSRWLKASTQYASTMFSAAERFGVWHSSLRPFVHWFLPYCKKLRQDAAQCRAILNTVLSKRKQVQKAAIREGDDLGRFNDSIEWAELAAKGNHYDPLNIHLTMGLGAIATTTNTLTWLLVCLAKCPDIIEPLREEVIGVLREGGWTKASLYNLKILDSAMKESQRLKPISLATMRRRAMKDVTLSDGTFLPRNTMSVVSSTHLRDPNLYPNPNEFDPYRFYNMRKIPGKENTGQFVTTSPEQPAFGHGTHACPGRFFASNQIKIAMCHILLKYDFKLSEGSPSDLVSFGLAAMANPGVRLDIRRRKAELDLDAF